MMRKDQNETLWIMPAHGLVESLQNYPKYSDRPAWANSVTKNAEPDESLHCLPLVKQIYTHKPIVQ